MKGRLVVIIPVKPFAMCKSRLASVLSPSERERMGRRFFERTLTAVSTAADAANVAVVSADPTALGLARDSGVLAIEERAEAGLNAALADATAKLVAMGAAAIAVVPTDLPLITTSTVQNFIARVRAAETEMAIAPDRHGQGTNALYLSPPYTDIYRFGPGSCELHQSAARHLGRRVFVYRSVELGLDIDTPADLALANSAGAKLLSA
jgi:2-phospho-L-lactate guanylyltransferase